MTSISNLPLEEGDRIDHKLFGFGTVIGIPFPPSQANLGHSDKPGTGYPVEVRWDDPDRKDTTVLSRALTKVSSPDTRPFVYWNRQWQPLRQAWIDARREVEVLTLSFRPVPDEHQLRQAMANEADAWVKVQEFLAEEALRAEKVAQAK